LPPTVVAFKDFTVQSVTFAHGGFARVGGIETFTADLVSALNARRVPTELICWSGRGKSENPALRELSRTDVRISRTDWRWGCRWGWPDRLMVLHQWRRFSESELLVFGKLLHADAHRRLLALKKRLILITPYRPAEMWKHHRPDAEILNSLDSIVVQARTFEMDLREFGYRGKVHILPLPPPGVSDASPWPASSTLQIGFLGRLVPDKNVAYLLHSFAQLRAMKVDAQLHIFGDGPERAALLQTAERLSLADRIRFHGNQDRTMIPGAIDRCHIFAFSSRTEGLPIGALEILSRGRPVLGTPVGAFPEFLSGLLGSIAPLDNPAAFAGALKSLAVPVLRGEVAPADVQRAYKARFPRRQVIDDYMRIFGCAEPARGKVRAL
jgi:glycosyltransferase involved in cell wall biosynthesis